MTMQYNEESDAQAGHTTHLISTPSCADLVCMSHAQPNHGHLFCLAHTQVFIPSQLEGMGADYIPAYFTG